MTEYRPDLQARIIKIRGRENGTTRVEGIIAPIDSREAIKTMISKTRSEYFTSDQLAWTQALFELSVTSDELGRLLHDCDFTTSKDRTLTSQQVSEVLTELINISSNEHTTSENELKISQNQKEGFRNAFNLKYINFSFETSRAAKQIDDRLGRRQI